MAGGNVPAPLAPVFAAAGKAFGIPPAILAGIASVETNLGQNLGPSSTGATGLMQFEPGTAKALGVNPASPRSAIFGAAKLLTQYGYHQNPARAIGAYNGGPGNPQMEYARQVMSEARRLAPQLAAPGPAGAVPGAAAQDSTATTVPTFDQKGFDQAQARYVAGSFLSQSDKSSPWDIGPKGASLGPNPLLSTGLLTTTPPNPADFEGSKTLQDATGKLQQIAGVPLANVHAGAGGYVNPIPGAVIGRTDMGVDATLKPGAPIRAIGNSRVVAISPNWYAGQPYVQLQLLDGPQKGRYYYVAEQITPAVRPGQTVKAGQPIGTYAPSGTGIEIGWGSPTPGRTQAQATTGYSEGEQTAAGQNFRAFLGNLK